ncbi:MAG: hypothetical protein ACR2O2_01510 [Ruegeria sp.]
MRRFALILALCPGLVWAQEYRRLNGDEILAALSGRNLKYENGASQVFEPSMFTQYFSEGPSSGQWAVRNDQYCSLWPPSDLWACYEVQQSGDVIRFVGEGGDMTVGRYSD